MLSVASIASAAEPPNIIFIMADDLGYGDLGCYNSESKIPTPSIDRLAKAGLRFTDAHAPAAVCVPTRYGLLTGRYPFRMGRRRGGSLIEEGRLTIGGLLRKKGYYTACVGKWHLGFGGHPAQDTKTKLRGGPTERGFDHYFGIPASLDIPPYYYIRDGHAVAAPTEKIGSSNSEGWTRIQGAFWRAGGNAPGFRHEDVLPRFAERSVAFLRQHRAKRGRQPFFLYLALAAPHTPWLPSKPFHKRSGAGMYGDFTAEVDHAVGQVLAAIDEIGAKDDTLVIFTSDNGPVWYDTDVKRFGHESVGKLRGMKGDAWEGGHRMPFIVRWPGKVKAGSTSDEIICHTDMLATFASLVGEKLPDDAGEDSYDVLPAMLGKKLTAPIREATVHQSSKRVLSIRQGKWKLIPSLGSGGFSKPSRQKSTADGAMGQLYDLGSDLSETKNVWKEHPDVVKKLTKLLETYRREGRSR
jgi:arylsulfatase A-like enzyme